MKGFIALRRSRFARLGKVVAGIVLVGCGAAYAQVEPAGETAPEEPAVRQGETSPVLSVSRTEPPASDERPVLSVNQAQSTLFEPDAPVLFLDPAVQLPEESLLDQRTGISAETILDEAVVPETKPSDGKEVQDRKKWALQLRGRVGFAYDDNIFISNTDRVADTILTVTGGISLIYGDWRSRSENFLVADYEAGGTFYLENPDQNSFNQIATLMGQYRIQRLMMQLRSQYLYLTGAERDIGDLATRNLINNSLRLSYDLSDKTAITAEGFANIATYQTFFNSYEFGTKVGADYKILQKVRVGPEIVVGFLNVVDSPFQVYEQIRARATYETTAKLGFEGSAGIEFRQFDSENRTFFVFSLAANYRPFAGTAITLRGYRRLYGSAALEGQDFIATGVELVLTQRFFQRIYLSVASGYENDEYVGIEPGVDAGRVDNYVFVRPAIAFAFTKWVSISAFYEFRNNFSNDADFAFSNNRVGGAIAFQF